MLEEYNFDLICAIYAVLIAIIFVIIYKRQKISFLWILGAIVNAIGQIFFNFRYIDVNYRIIGNFFWFLAVILFSLWVIHEYRTIFMKKENYQIESTTISKNLIVFQTFSFILLSLIQVALIFYVIIIFIMLLRLYLMNKSITHLFILLVLVSGLLTVLFSFLNTFNITGAWDVAYIMKIIYYTSLLATGLSTPIEKRLNKSEKKYFEAYNRAEFYKDLFAHDISNILQNVQSSMELLPHYFEKPNDKNTLDKLIDLVKRQVTRGADLVSNIRKLSEIEESEFLLESIEICEWLNKAIEFLKKSYNDKKISIQINSSDKEYYVKANKLILNVFENILVNCVKYNNNSSIQIFIKISFTTIKNINYVQIEFIDNGIGIPDNMKEKVFHRAFMKERSVSGMGLGLSLVHKIIEKYNGQIWVEDKIKGDYSQGSNFIMIIPKVF
jgi:signal transduction histidine kinase